MWAFTPNDCSMWLICDDVYDNRNTDAYAVAYCNAFRQFSSSPGKLAEALVAGTTRLLGRGVYVDKKQTARVLRPINDRDTDSSSFYSIDFQRLIKSADDQKGSYQLLCNSNAATPCTAKSNGGCDTQATAAHRQCNWRDLKSYFTCVVDTVLTPPPSKKNQDPVPTDMLPELAPAPPAAPAQPLPALAPALAVGNKPKGPLAATVKSRVQVERNSDPKT